MGLANDSILITPGTGASIATQVIDSKELQVMVQADEFGHILGSRDTYWYDIPQQVHVASANTIHWDLFNADASLLVRVVSVRHIPNMVTAVATGVAFSWKLARTTAVGTGGAAQTALLADMSQTALDADITCRSKPTGGATEGVILRNYALHGEETNAAAVMVASLGGLELVPQAIAPPNSEHGILLRQDQGLRCVQITNSALGYSGWLIVFTVE